ncbi:MAG: heavy-metal-associated domain-containing protein, partial [Gemmatimonadota bacterium]
SLCDLCQTPAARATLARAGMAPFSPAAALVMSPPPQDTLQQVTFHVEGMTCGGCAVATRKVLARLPGVTHADVSYEQQRAVVTYDPAKVNPAQMIAAIETLDYTARLVAGPEPAPATGAPRAPTGPAAKP